MITSIREIFAARAEAFSQFVVSNPPRSIGGCKQTGETVNDRPDILFISNDDLMIEMLILIMFTIDDDQYSG